MTILRPAPVTTARFHREAGTRLFTAEMSDLGRDFRLGQVYDDACDEGLTLVSVNTGREIVMAVSHEQRDGEGELQWIDLTPARPSDAGLATVRLYND